MNSLLVLLDYAAKFLPDYCFEICPPPIEGGPWYMKIKKHGPLEYDKEVILEWVKDEDFMIVDETYEEVSGINECLRKVLEILEGL